jgi:ParB/RepB/Spo0J family partition protein
MPMTDYSLNSGAAVAETTTEQVAPAPTMPPAEQSFAMLPHHLIVPSLTNPRKKFDEAKLAELAASIKGSGVHQPILVRPLPESRLADTFRSRKPGRPLPTHELVAGERRWRACQIAGVAEIPCMVKPLTDHQVLEVQIVENLQRDDLSELEEAEGYAALAAATGISKDQIGERIGRSRTYVYGRLKLLELCPPAREALREGKLDASRALLIARIPSDKLQIKALKEFCAKDYAGDSRMGYRAALAWIKQNVMLKLAEARFDIADANLVPDVGNCTNCPKRTGFDPDLFADVDAPDLCTDTACYQSKQDAHTAVITAKARAKGMEVIDGKEALELMPHSYYQDPKGFTKLDDLVYSSEAEATIPLREVLTKTELKGQVKLFIDPHTGAAVEVIPDDLANETRAKLRKAVPAQESEYQRQERAEQEKQALAIEYERRWRAPAAEAIERGIQGGKVTGFEAPILRELLLLLVQHDDTDEEMAARVLQVPTDVELYDAAKGAIAAIPDLELGARICILMVNMEAAQGKHWSNRNRLVETTPVIDCLATTCEVDLQAIKAEIQDTMRAEAAEKAEPAPAAKKGRKGKKVEGADA